MLNRVFESKRREKKERRKILLSSNGPQQPNKQYSYKTYKSFRYTRHTKVIENVISKNISFSMYCKSIYEY